MAIPAARLLHFHAPNLSMLASQAAVQLDNLIRDGSSVHDAVDALAELLTEALRDTKGNRLVILARPGFVQVFSQALSDSGYAKKAKNLSELTAQLRTLESDINSDMTKVEDAKQEQLRDFCAKLSLAASDYLSQKRESGPLHPHKR